MVESPRSKHLSLPIVPLAATVIGLLTAAMFALIPTDLLESMVVDSGIASVLSAAEPPLGFTARLVLVLLCGGGVGALAWFGLFLIFGARTIVVQRSRKGGDKGGDDVPISTPVLRRADSHPDAPARRPLFANTDLGTPFLEVRARPVHIDAAVIAPNPAAAPVEQPLPTDLDQPLAAYDPAAVPEAPRAWFPAPVELNTPKRRQTFDPGERFETFPLTPMVRPAPPPHDEVGPATADPAETVHALLDRLERVAAGRRFAQTAPPESTPEPVVPAPISETIEDTLTALRRMATR